MISKEHEVLRLEGISIEDVDQELRGSTNMVLELSCDEGKLSFGKTSYAMRNYLFEDRGAGSTIVMNDTILNINEALSEVRARPHLLYSHTLSPFLMNITMVNYLTNV